jgi:hypothetical protein
MTVINTHTKHFNTSTVTNPSSLFRPKQLLCNQKQLQATETNQTTQLTSPYDKLQQKKFKKKWKKKTDLQEGHTNNDQR